VEVMETKILNKFLSARWLVTVALATTFCYITWKGEVPSEVFVPIFVVVLNYYFKEKRRNGEDEKTISVN
jgi:hypothetical protein